MQRRRADKVGYDLSLFVCMTLIFFKKIHIKQLSLVFQLYTLLDLQLLSHLTFSQRSSHQVLNYDY